MSAALPTRDRILSSATRLVLQQGEAALSMRSIGSKVGVSATAIYRHFPEKAALLDAVVAQAFATFEQYLRRGTPKSGGRLGLRRFARQYLEFAIAEPRLFEVLFLKRRHGQRRFPEDFAPGGSPSFDLVVNVVRLGREAGTIRARGDERELALSIWTHGHGFAALYSLGYFGSDLARIRRLYDRSIEHFLTGLAP
jgi:AcrR family transcriptional regulator